MRLGISNIAWERHDDPKVFSKLRGNNVTGIEVAPTKIWPEWKDCGAKSAKAYRNLVNGEGFKIPALQAILFGKPDLQVFQAETHGKFFEHLKLIAEIAEGLGAQTLVFGSPKNRKRGAIGMTIASQMAVDFFSKAGNIFEGLDCCLCIEHNPVEYGSDYVTNVADARELVQLVNHDKFKLHLDAGGMHMCGGDIVENIKSAGFFAHYHISEPMLEPIANGVVDHQGAFKALKGINYDNWVSIEMKQPAEEDGVVASLRHVNDCLANAGVALDGC